MIKNTLAALGALALSWLLVTELTPGLAERAHLPVLAASPQLPCYGSADGHIWHDCDATDAWLHAKRHGWHKGQAALELTKREMQLAMRGNN